VPVSFARGRLGREERRRGELVHRILELLGSGPADMAAALEAAGARAARETREAPDAALKECARLARMMAETALGSYFSAAPGRAVYTEQEFCDATGRLFRMDRVIIDTGTVTVIDFKTGAEEPAEHGEQVRGYMRILSDVFPGRAIAAAVAYIDLGLLRSIE
jgi:RecB family exonuclease